MAGQIRHPPILDMILCNGALRVWAERSGIVHIASHPLQETEPQEEVLLTPAAWDELVIAIRLADWERRS
jgi:hypothetical protein